MPQSSTHKSQTPAFDLSFHPTLDAERVQEFLRKGDILPEWSTRDLDAVLLAAFEEVTLIGELPITEAGFRRLGSIVRGRYIRSGKLYIKEVYPALYVTSMVFTGRYSQLDTRNFWEPYLRIIWQQADATQSLQLQAREHFKQARAFLADRFPHLKFRVYSAGEVVRPVYHHAMIPHYLEDNFADWVRSNYETILSASPEVLPSTLRADPSVAALPNPLSQFITNRETGPTAAELARDLSEAIGLYEEGEAIEAIESQLTNPILRALWQHTAMQLKRETLETSTKARRTRPRLQWIWSLDDQLLKLRLTNLTTAQPPTACVWIHASQTPADIHDLVPVFPWLRDDGTYLLDELILEDGPVDGEIVVLGGANDDEVLFRGVVPPLPAEPIIFYRLTQQMAYAIPLTQALPGAAGDWVVSMASGVTIFDAQGKPVVARQTFAVPAQLREATGHTTAGQYPLDFPLSVQNQGKEILRIAPPQVLQVAHAEVHGASPIPGLAAEVPPAFSDIEVHLQIPVQIDRPKRIILRLVAQTGHTRAVPLSDLPAVVTSEGTRISLSGLLKSNRAGVYEVDLRENLRSLLPAPLQFSVLPGITIVGPDPERLYTSASLPSAHLKGISISEIATYRNRVHKHQGLDGISATWPDLDSQPLTLTLEIRHQPILLAWHVRRFSIKANVGGQAIKETDTVTVADLANIAINVRGVPNQYFQWVVGSEKRPATLNSRGRLDVDLKNDALFDMLRGTEVTPVTLLVEIGGEQLPVFSFEPLPSVQEFSLSYDASQPLLTVNWKLVPQPTGRLTVRLTPRLSSAVPVIFDLAQFTTGIAHLRKPKLPPDQYTAQLRVGKQLLDHPPVELLILPSTASVVQSATPTSDLLAPHELLNALCQPSRPQTRPRHDPWPPLRHLRVLHNPDAWVKKHGLLPAWCVTTHDLFAHSSLHRRQWKLQPEMASHGGQQGIGRLIGDQPRNPLVLYARWRRTNWSDPSSASSHLRVFVPPPRYTGLMIYLNEEDLWPVYQCRMCGDLSTQRPTKMELSYVRRHYHGRPAPRPEHIFYDIGNEWYSEQQHTRYRLLTDISIDKRTRSQRPHVSVVSTQATDIPAPLHTANGHAWARTRANHSIIAQWVPHLSPLRQWIIAPSDQFAPMVTATARMLRFLAQLDDQSSATVLSAALMWRSEAYLRTDHRNTMIAMRQQIPLSDEQMADMALDFVRDAPDLLEWALQWVELFYIHTHD